MTFDEILNYPWKRATASWAVLRLMQTRAAEITEETLERLDRYGLTITENYLDEQMRYIKYRLDTKEGWLTYVREVEKLDAITWATYWNDDEWHSPDDLKGKVRGGKWVNLDDSIDPESYLWQMAQAFHEEGGQGFFRLDTATGIVTYLGDIEVPHKPELRYLKWNEDEQLHRSFLTGKDVEVSDENA